MNIAHVVHGTYSSFRVFTAENKNAELLLKILNDSIRVSLIQGSTDLELILSLLVSKFENNLQNNWTALNITHVDALQLQDTLNTAIIECLVAVAKRESYEPN
jgi:hypothetical protein